MNMIFLLSIIVLFSQFSPRYSNSVVYYVTYNSTASCSTFSECGSLSSPFTSILDLFYHIDSSAAQINANFSDISVILINDYYIIDPFNVSFYLNKLNTLYDETKLFWAVFENIRNINIAISSYNKTQTATISFRTLKIGFKIDQCTFLLDRLILDFLQIDYSINTALDCLFWKEGCCKYKEQEISEEDPCFFYVLTPYTVDTYFNFIEIHHQSFAMIGFSNCEINNLNLPKRYEDFFVKSFLYDSSENILLNFVTTKIQNISVNGNYFIGSNSFISRFLIYKQKYFNFFLCTLDYYGFQQGNTIFSLNNYETVTFLVSNITNVLRLAVLNSIQSLYLTNSIFLTFKQDNIPAYISINDYISNSIYGIYLEDSVFSGPFYDHYILNNEGSTYIHNTNFTGLALNTNPFFLLKYISFLDITNMIIVFESVSLRDQNVFDFTSLNSIFINELQIFNYGTMSLTLFTLHSIFSVFLNKVLVNANTTREYQFVLFHFRSLGMPIIILNSILMKTSLFFDGLDTVCVFFTNFSTEYDSNAPIFSFLDSNKIYLLSCSFTKIFYNKAGGIFSIGNQNDLLISKSRFSLLENSEGGTVISARSSNHIKIQASNFSDIFSFDKGGAILLNENNILIINNSRIENISAINSGGFLFASQASNLIWIAASFVSTVFSTEGGFILLNYKSFLYISKTYIKSAGVSYLGGAFNLRTSNLAFIVNCTFEMLISEEAAGFFSLIESNKLFASELKVKHIISKSNIGNIYLRSNNEMILINCEIITVESNLIYLDSDNSVILIQFKINNANDVLFNINQYNVISLNKVTIMNYFSSQELFYVSNKNIIFINDTEIKEEINQNIEWVFKIVASNTLKFVQTNFTFLNLFGIIALDQDSQISINQTKFKIGKVTDTLIKVVNSKILINQLSFNNELQDNLSGSSRDSSLKLFTIRNSSFYLYKSSFNANKGKRNFQFGEIVTSNVYVDNSIFINDHGLGKISNFLTCKFSALIISKSSFVFSNINSTDSKNIIFKSEFHFSWNTGFDIHITDKKYENLFATLIKNSFFLKHDRGVFNFLSNRQNYQSQMKIYRCFFAFNSAEKGSVLMGFNLISFKFTNNRVYANRGKGNKSKLSKGGVFYFFSNFSSFNYSYHVYQSNNFMSNKADAGGVFFLQTGFPFLSQNEIFLSNNFTKNLAYYYGNEITSCTTSLGLEENIRNINLPNLISGHTYPTCLAFFSALDYYSQKTTNNNDEYSPMLTEIGLGLEYKINLSENWSIYQGMLCFGGYLKNIYLSDSNIFWNNITFNYLNQTSSTVYLSYNFRKCTRGEKMDDDFRCTECLRNFFSFTSNIDFFSNCLICSGQLGFFCFGGSQITIKKGFWRKNKDSANILACLNIDACLGDERIFDDNSEYLEEYSVSRCAEGYLDPLCAVCKAGWGLNSSYVCSVCGSYEYILKSLCLTLIQLFFLALTVQKSYIISKGLYTGSFKIENMISMELLKLFSIHAQLSIVIFSVKGSIINIRSIFEVNPFNSNISDNFSLQCLAQVVNINLPYYFSKLLVSLNTTFLIFIISVIFITVLIKKNIGTNRIVIGKIGLFSTLKTMFFVTISLQTSNILRDCLDGLIYVNIADPEQEPDVHLLADPSIYYFSQEFQLIRNLVIIPVILLLGIFFPIFLFLQQYQNRKFGSLENKNNLFLYGYFFYSYEDDKFYWDLVISFRKLLILTIISFSKDIEFQTEERGLLTFCIVSIFLILTLFTLNKIEPYKEELQIVHKAEESSLLVFLLSMIVLIPNLTNQSQASNDHDRVKNLAPAFIIYSINAGFYLIFVFEYIKYTNIEKLVKYLPKRVRNSKAFSGFITNLSSLVPSSKSKVFSSKKNSFKSSAFQQNNEHTSNRKKVNTVSDSIGDLRANENMNLEAERIKNKITSWDKERKEVSIFLKGAARKKELLLQKMQKMALKNLHQSKAELENAINDSKYKTQIICFEEGIKGIIYKDEEMEVKLIYWRTDEIVNYKILIHSFAGIFILNSGELILNNGRESKIILQNHVKKAVRVIFLCSVRIDKKFINLPILRLDLWLKEKKDILDLILPLPFLHYIPFTSSSCMFAENEINFLSILKEKIIFTTSSSFIRRITILHRMYEFKYKNLSKMCTFMFLTKERNNIIFFWSPIFGKKIGKMTIHFVKGDRKLVGMIRKMMEII